MLEHGGDWAGYEMEYGTLPMDFSANVSPLGLPEGVRLAAAGALETANRYPDPLCRRLREEIGKFHGVSPEQVLCGNGAAELIYRLVPAAGPNRAMVTAPCFSEYEHALELTSCEIRRHLLRQEDDFRVTEALLDALTEELDLLFLCEPGNPAGVTTDHDLLLRILERCAEKNILVVADECFLPFLMDAEARTLISLTTSYPNLLVLRAFTKCYGMAGLRLGYCICRDRGLLEKMALSGQPWPVSNVAQAAGIAALREDGYLESLRELISEERPRLRCRLEQLGFHVIPGEANYLLFRSETENLGELLRSRGILIRDCSGYHGLSSGWYRIAVKTKEENDRLLAALGGVI